MSISPATVERLLESLSDATPFRDGVLGDLAEELAIRTHLHGERAARRWYLREAVRVAPHLVWHWAGSLRASDVRRTLNVVLLALMLTFIVGFVVLGGLIGIAVAIGAERLDRIALPVLVWVGLHWTWFAVLGLFGGAVAASLAKRASLVHAIALGICWVVVGNAWNALRVFGLFDWMGAQFFIPAFYVAAVSVVVVVATSIGGALYVRSQRGGLPASD